MSFVFSQDGEGIGTLLFDLPNKKVNTFSKEVLQELADQLKQLPSTLKGLVLKSGKPHSFIAGADLHSFEPSFKKPEIAKDLINLGHKTFNLLAALPFPTVAVIDGPCLGGGLECALACDFRIVTDHPKTQLGLPEVTLGIIPGWGGTQRLPRLIGLQKGMSMIASGKAVNGKKAFQMGLADALIGWEFLEDQLPKKIAECLKKSPSRKSPILDKIPFSQRVVGALAKRSVLAKTKGHFPAPLVAIDLIIKTFRLPLKEGLEEEAKTFVYNISTTFSGASELIQLFFTQEMLKKKQWTKKAPSPINYAAVVGAGTMGAGIAWLFSKQNIPVRLKDIHWKAVSRGIAEASSINQKLISIKKMLPYEAPLKLAKIGGCLDYSGFKLAQIAIEAAIEDEQLKMSILKELEENIGTECIIGTNTSSLSIPKLATCLKHPERFLGIHFFNPANRMPLVEIAPTDFTSEQTIATTVLLMQQMGKIPIVVKPCPGLLVNRIFAACICEVMRLVDAGVPLSRLESAFLNYGFPMGPFTLADTIGNDVNSKVLKGFAAAYGKRMEVPSFVDRMVEKGWLGNKSGKGFFDYEGGMKRLNSDLISLLPKKNLELSDEALEERLFTPLYSEAKLCLKEGIVENRDFIKLALVLGIGFPPTRQLFY